MRNGKTQTIDSKRIYSSTDQFFATEKINSQKTNELFIFFIFFYLFLIFWFFIKKLKRYCMNMLLNFIRKVREIGELLGKIPFSHHHLSPGYFKYGNQIVPSTLNRPSCRGLRNFGRIFSAVCWIVDGVVDFGAETFWPEGICLYSILVVVCHGSCEKIRSNETHAHNEQIKKNLR